MAAARVDPKRSHSDSASACARAGSLSQTLSSSAPSERRPWPTADPAPPAPSRTTRPVATSGRPRTKLS